MTTIESLVTSLNEDYVRDPGNKVWNLATKHRAINKGYTKIQEELNWNE
jgi:phosphate uptake regulator